MWYKLSRFFAETYWLFAALFLFWAGWRGMRKRDIAHVAASKKWADAVAKNLHEPASLHPEINPSLCAGCGACVTACPEGEIIQMINHKAVLVEPTKCVGHGECETSCPMDAITLVFGTKTRGMELPRVDGNYETNVPGLYIAGELGGMGLIRNAVKQGRIAAESAVKSMKSRTNTAVDVLIVGAGPAGLSASIACAHAKTPYLCIEQNKFGGTIYNFPRQKVVMSHPVEFPGIGKVKFSGNQVSKEELLSVWGGLRKNLGLKIQEETKFVNLEKQGDVFKVTTSRGPMTAKKVILAMGVRGTPRKLGLKGEDSTKVTYNLLDPEQYQQKWIAVVGGGNAAVEAAQYLCRAQYRNKVFLLVRSAFFDRCNEENQKLIEGYARQGLVKILFNTVVDEILPTQIIIKKDNQKHTLQNDFLFIFAGAELPFEFLKKMGIMVDKKFGVAAPRRKGS